MQYGEIIVNFVPVNEQVFGILTKPLTENTFIPCRMKLGVFYVEELHEVTSPSSHLHTELQEVPLLSSRIAIQVCYHLQFTNICSIPSVVILTLFSCIEVMSYCYQKDNTLWC